MNRKLYTTREAAEEVGVTRATLQIWIRARKFATPKTQLRNGVGIRLWTVSDVEKIRRYKHENYRKGRGRKAKPKR